MPPSVNIHTYIHTYIQKNFRISSQTLSCSHSDWSACTFKYAGKNKCKDHSKDVFLTCSGVKSHFSLVNQVGTQISGQQEFSLLYNGATVCGDNFNDNAAHASCKDMGYYHGAKTWRKDHPSSQSRSKYKMSLDECTKDDWKSCSYSYTYSSNELLFWNIPEEILQIR